MGLDMYLNARRFLWVFHDGTGEDAEPARRLQESFTKIAEAGMQPSYVIAQAIYWRKANAIHRWFVENVQDDKDDCRSYPVSRKQLANLADLCDQVLKDPSLAPRLLPRQSGFFFGSTDYDEWYAKDLTYTRDRIKALLAMPALERWDFEYQSSW